MSIAKSIIGEPAPKPESKTVQAEAETPVHPMDLIDSLVEQEIREGSASSTSVKHAFHKKKVKGASGGKAPVAKAPGSVKYGKK